MANSLVDNLRPVARDQVKLRDRILRATVTSAEQGAKGNSTALQWDMGAYASFQITLAGDSSAFAVDGSNDLQAWVPLDIKLIGTGSMPLSASSFYQENAALVSGIPTTVLVGSKQTKFVRVRAQTPSISRNSSVQVTLSQTPFVASSPSRHFGPDNAWTYSTPAGGISGTTAVSMIGSLNTYHRRVITQMEVGNAGTAGTEILISDGTAAVFWRGYLGAGAVQSMQFDPPLRVNAGTGINITLGTASVPIYLNARGITTLA
jgi:hypothetical protein